MTNSDTRPEPEGTDLAAPAGELSDHEYFRKLEQLFISLRGAPLLLSPSDWRTASTWRRKGIPLDVVARVLREIFERSSESKGLRGVRSLKYFDAAVQRAWEQVRELGVSDGDRSAGEALDLDSRLNALSRSLPDDLEGVEAVRRQILSLEGAAQEVEGALASLDSRLLQLAEKAVDEATRASIETRVDEAVRRISRRMDTARIEETRTHLRKRSLRRALGLPVLSLFSQDAVGSGGDAGRQEEE